MDVDMRMDVPSVSVNRAWRPGVVIRRIITPIPARPIRTVVAYPESIVNDRSCHIYRLIDVIIAIHVNIAYDLDLDGIVRAFFDFDGCHILENIFFKDSLDNDNVRIAFDRFDDPQIIDPAVAIEVKIRNLGFRVIEPPFKIFKVFRLAKNRGDSP